MILHYKFLIIILWIKFVSVVVCVVSKCYNILEYINIVKNHILKINKVI